MLYKNLLLVLCLIFPVCIYANTCPLFSTIYDQNNHSWLKNYDGWNLIENDDKRENDLSGFQKVHILQPENPEVYIINCYYYPNIEDGDNHTRVYIKKNEAYQGLQLIGDYWNEIRTTKVCQPPVDHMGESSCEWKILT